MLRPGIYEQVMNTEISEQIERITELEALTEHIDEAEAPIILAQYAKEIIRNGLYQLAEVGNGTSTQIDLINRIVGLIAEATQEKAMHKQEVDSNSKMLLAMYRKKDSDIVIKGKEAIIRPTTSLSQSSLFTGVQHEPSMYEELRREILSSNRIEMLVSFIKWSGLRLIIDELREFTKKGGQLFVITTPYMGATDLRAVEELRELANTKLKISYDTKRTRLHAKAYVFHRDTGFTTAYVGSSNLSNVAISSGLEWNIKVTAKDLPETISKISATFQSYWNSSDFADYGENQKENLRRALSVERNLGVDQGASYAFHITPYFFQQEILDKLDAERNIHGHYRNLVVAATGTGKTVVSAFDYKRFCQKQPKETNKLLFIAHREEILKQSVECFRGVLRDENFGSLFVGNYEPRSIEHLFMSIQTFNSQNWHEKTSPGFYDYIVVDEFHHAAAPSYQKLLNHYKPKVLLGLTATPERMDGKSVIEYFDNRIAAEIRLTEAIERKLLCPFHYFGVSDNTDLRQLKWTRGGYDKTELSNVYTINNLVANRRCESIVAALNKYVTSVDLVKGLGFCVSVAHAEFMSDWFNRHNIPSMVLTGQTLDADRADAKRRLVNGEIRFIFVVDIYNEGVDIPEVDTILFLRPTESLTIFLQQLGRGLRFSDDKECLTVLDFIGQANKRYNFEEKFSALLSYANRSTLREIKDGFTNIPKGCFIHLEPKAREYVLENISSSIGKKASILRRIRDFEEDTERPLSLTSFVDHYHLDVRDIYNVSSFSRLCVDAGTLPEFSEPLEGLLEKAFKRICRIDSRRWIKFVLQTFLDLENTSFDTMNELEKKMLQMMHFTIWQKPLSECGYKSYEESWLDIKRNPTMSSELIALLKYCYDRIDFVDEQVELGFNSPLDLYCTYSRDQVLAALDYLRPGSVREGVKWLEEKRLDIFFITLNKSEKEYSPTTMYNDYSINEWLFHWQSQSTTSEDSPTGQRYIEHKKKNSKILLFVREHKKEGYGAEPYTFLGLADYVSHEGSKPMSIIFKLQKPIPSRFIKKTNKLIVG